MHLASLKKQLRWQQCRLALLPACKVCGAEDSAATLLSALAWAVAPPSASADSACLLSICSLRRWTCVQMTKTGYDPITLLSVHQRDQHEHYHC